MAKESSSAEALIRFGKETISFNASARTINYEIGQYFNGRPNMNSHLKIFSLIEQQAAGQN